MTKEIKLRYSGTVEDLKKLSLDEQTYLYGFHGEFIEIMSIGAEGDIDPKILITMRFEDGEAIGTVDWTLDRVKFLMERLQGVLLYYKKSESKV